MFEGNGVTSPSPELLFSLGIALGTALGIALRMTLSVLLLALLSTPASTTTSLFSLFSSSFSALGVRHVGSCQTTPVKLFSCRGLRSHLRQGAPERSRARRPAFIAPVLALGPSL